MSDAQTPLPMAPAPCWRCGAPSQRPESRYALCLTCLAMIAEIATLHQRPVPASGAEDPPRGEDFYDNAFTLPPRRTRVRARW